MRVGLVGLGLIGGSLGKALLDAGHRVSGWDVDPEVARRAHAQGAVEDLAADPPKLAQAAEVVVLAVPVGAIARVARQVAPGLSETAVVTDVGSVKASVMEAVEAVLPAGVPFVGGHPIAGDDRSGPEAARADLFAGRPVVLCPPTGGPQAERAMAVVSRMWTDVGAQVETMDPRRHDRILAATSHLPHAVSFALAGVVGAAAEEDAAALRLSAGGLRDMLRIAGSSPALWRDVFLHNQGPLLDLVGRYQEELLRLRRRIESGDAEGLLRFLEAAADRRRWLTASP